MKQILVLLSTSMGLFPTMTAASDVMIMSNGDRLSGEYLGQQDGKHLFRSELLGEVRVPLEKAKIEKSDAATAASTSATTSTPPTAAVPPPVTPAAPAAVTSKEDEDPDGFLAWWKENRPLKDWKSRFVFSMTWQEGERNRTDYTLDFSTTRSVGPDDFRYILEHNQATQPTRFGTAKVADRWFTELRWRHTLSDRWFTQTNTSYLTDQIKKIDHRLEQSVGVGYIYLKEPKWTGTITPALTVKNQRLGGKDSGTDLYNTIFQDLSWRPTPRLTFGQDATYSYDLNESQNYNWIFGLRFEAKLEGGLTYNLRYSYDYDHFLPLGIQREQQRLTTGFGYSF